MDLSREDAAAHRRLQMEQTVPTPRAVDAAREGSPPRRRQIARWSAEILQTVLLTLVIFSSIRSVVQNFQIDGPSMLPTLEAGQFLLVNKLAYLRLEGAPLRLAQSIGIHLGVAERAYVFGAPQHGDIVVFREPVPPYIDLVKRVIGVPGDQIRIDRGQVYVNGVQLREGYVRATPGYSLQEQTVPPGHFFVLGDNRPVSSDSHLWGFVPEDNIIGKAWIRYWPPEDWGLLPAVDDGAG
ncbi:MAG: signal peptidase I [Sphingomonadaceae bacterium]